MIEFDNRQNDQLTMFNPIQEVSLGDDVEIDDDFSYEGFQVVRGEFISDRMEPSISFNNDQIYVNTVCLNKLSDTDYVQILINKHDNILALRPCGEDERDSFLWRTINRKTGKRQPKYITARIFSAMLFEHMGWSKNNRYKLIGKLKIARGIKMFVFDLTAFKMFARKSADGESVPRNARGQLPIEWKGQFGMPVEEHDRSMEITTFRNFAVFDVKGNNNPEPYIPKGVET